jgi:hypothetical protein
MWSLKHFALEKFIQIARKVRLATLNKILNFCIKMSLAIFLKIIVRSRMMKNLNALKVFTDEWLKSRYSVSKIDAFLTLDGFVGKSLYAFPYV